MSNFYHYTDDEGARSIISPPSTSTASTKSNSKIGRIKILTPAEINQEFNDSPNSASVSMPVDSPDRLRAFSFADFLRPPNPSPSVPIVSTVSQLKEPSAKVIKPKRRSRYPGFGEVVKPKRKSKYPGFGETILFEKIKTKTSASLPKTFQSESSSSREIQEKVGGNSPSSSQLKVNLAQYQVTPRCPKPVFNHPQGIITPAAVTRSYPNVSSVTTSFSMLASVTPALTKSYPKVSSVTTSFPMPASVTSFPRPSSVIISCPTPASVTTSLPNEAGSGIRRNYPGFGETEIPSRSQGNRLKEHRVSDTDARNISASWQKLKPTEVSTSTSVSKSNAAGSSSSQIAQDQVGESFCSRFKAILPKPQDSPKLHKQTSSKQLKPGIGKEKLDKISKQTGFHLRRANKVNTSSSLSFPANLTGSQVNEKTKYKGLPSSVNKTAEPSELNFYRESSESKPVSFSHFKSVPNKTGVEESKIRKKYPGFGEIITFKDSQVIGKTKNNNKSSKNSQKISLEVWDTVKLATREEKVSSHPTSLIHKLDEMSKPREEDWDSSLRDWIPSEPYDHVQKRKVKNAYRGFGEVTKSVKSQANKNKSDTGVRSRFEKTNRQQAKIQKVSERKGINLSGENFIGSPTSIANISTESTLEDFSSECTEKTDENYNNNDEENFEVQNANCNYDDMSTDTDTEDGGRKRLLDGVVLTISGYEDPLRGRIVRKAVAMGARYRPGWTNDCSHLVCGFIGTFKYLQAKGRGKIVLGTWIEDCYKSKKKVDWMEYILSEKKADNDPVLETSSSSDGLRFLAGMEVRVKESYLFKQLAGKAGFVRGMHSDTVQVVIQGCGQLYFFPSELEHLLPERGSKAKYVMKGHGENIMEVIYVDECKGIAVVRCDGQKGAVVRLNHLCRVSEDAIVCEI